jgi:hypothetical protein
MVAEVYQDPRREVSAEGSHESLVDEAMVLPISPIKKHTPGRGTYT